MLEKLVEAILQSPKYSNISQDLIRRVAEQSLHKYPKHKEALKAAKSKLHQVAGAYWKRQADYDKWLAQIRAVAPDDQAGTQAVCREVMRHHSSSAERLGILAEFYETLFAKLPPISSILDLACGLNPLAIPFMPISPETRYTAGDIYADQMAFLQSVFDHWGLNAVARQCDIFSTTFEGRYDLALLLKSLACLEQVEKDSAAQLLQSIPARYIFVTYPTASLAGRLKGMRQHYTKAFNSLQLSPAWQITQLEFDTEIGFLVEKG